MAEDAGVNAAAEMTTAGAADAAKVAEDAGVNGAAEMTTAGAATPAIVAS